MSYITEMDMNAAPAPLCASLLSFAIELPHLRVFRPTFLVHVIPKVDFLNFRWPLLGPFKPYLAVLELETS